MRTAIVGKFLRGKLLEGDHRRIIGYRYAIPIGIVIHESFFRISLAHRIKYYVTYLFRCENGILALRFSKKRVHMQGTGRAPYQFEEPTATFITSSPKMMDPYERSNLYIGESKIEGILLHLVRWYIYIHI